jgi:hypothetical protein
MRTGRIIAAILVTTLALLSAPASPTLAQTDVAKKAIAKTEKAITQVANSCVTDVRTFCSTVTPGDGRIALCLAAHEDKISNTCYGALLDVIRDVELAANRLSRTIDICRGDLAKHCAKVPEGQGRIAQCLIDNKSKLTAACRTEVGAVEARLKK